jgi:hypothetical protein
MSDSTSLNTGASLDTSVTPAPEGHDAAMAAKFDAAQVAPGAEGSAAPQRPDHIPEKFWKDGQVDVEGLAKSYRELEKKQSGAKTEDTPADATKTETPPPPATPADVTPEHAQTATPDATREALKSTGLDYDAISARFQANGKLADEDRAALKGIGLTDSVIDSYIAGQQAQANQFVATVTEPVGGPQEYAKIQTWAAANMTPAEKVAFNNIMNGSDVEAAKFAIAGLKSKYDAAVGVEPQLVNSGNTAPSLGPVYRDNSELMKDMQDPRYKTSEAFRRDVRERLARSNIL